MVFGSSLDGISGISFTSKTTDKEVKERLPLTFVSDLRIAVNTRDTAARTTVKRRHCSYKEISLVSSSERSSLSNEVPTDSKRDLFTIDDFFRPLGYSL